MRVVLGGSASSAAAAALARTFSSTSSSSASLRRSCANQLLSFGRRAAPPRPVVSTLGRRDGTSRAPSILPRASSSFLTSLHSSSRVGGLLGSVNASSGAAARAASSSARSKKPSSSQLRLRTVAPPRRRHPRGARSDAARGDQHLPVALSQHRKLNVTNPGDFVVGGLPHSTSLGLWRPTGAVLAQYYSSSPMGGGPGRGSGGGGGGNRWAAGGLGLVGAASVLLGKSKYLLGALKLTKLASLGSMVLTVGTYSMFFGVPYAAGMVGLILVHETGHALVMRNRGVDFSPMVFVPFVGAFIAMRNRPRDAYEDALIAFGGPVLGGAGAGAVAIGAAATQSQLLFALADFGFMINLFNLLPIGAMDGGRIASALSPYAGVAGLGLGGMMAYSGAVHNPIFYLILLAGGWETFQRFYNPASTPPNYYRITPLQRATLTTSYFGLVAALMAGMAWNHRYQKPPEVLMRERQRELSWDMR